MDKIGFIKSFDGLGRIVIPKELRERYIANPRNDVMFAHCAKGTTSFTQ